MNLEVGSHVQGIDSNGIEVDGLVVRFLINTVVIEKSGNRFLLSKSVLRKQGYTSEELKRSNVYNTDFSLAEKE